MILWDGAWIERIRQPNEQSKVRINFVTETGGHAYGDTLADAIDAAWAMREGGDE